jgi:glyoxylase-like metal-dependent hydrolase (beta-lactamase superfamily II)
MKLRTAFAIMVAGLTACQPDTRPESGPDVGAGSSDGMVRTADPVKRGLSEAEFPRVQRISENVYTYEQLRSAGEERFTTVSLIVVTEAGVLVADGQGNLEETERLVAKIGEITDRPITHVVIASDHGDHTAGNAAFGPAVKVIAHPASKAILDKGPSSVSPQPITAVEDKLALTLGATEVHILFLGRALRQPGLALARRAGGAAVGQ